MNIAVDASELANRREDGTQIYLYNLLKHIAHIDRKNQYVLYYQHEPKKIIEAPNFTHVVKPWPAYWTQSRLPTLLFRETPDVLFMPIQTLPFVMPSKTKKVITIHDLAFMFYPETFPTIDWIKHRVFAWHAIKKADKIIAVSEATKKDIIKLYSTLPEKINVIHHGYDDELFRPFQNQNDCDIIGAVKNKYRITKPYVLYIGALQPRKNIVGLVKAFELLNASIDTHRLVIAGGHAWLYEEAIEYIKKTPYRDKIILTGRFETGELPALLWGSELLVLPSFYEGFGLPIIEAMACGVPVITSNVSSLPEVAGNAAILVDPKNTESVAEAMRRILNDKNLKQKIIQDGFQNIKRFSWEKCARETLEVFHS